MAGDEIGDSSVSASECGCDEGAYVDSGPGVYVAEDGSDFGASAGECES